MRGGSRGPVSPARLSCAAARARSASATSSPGSGAARWRSAAPSASAAASRAPWRSARSGRPAPPCNTPHVSTRSAPRPGAGGSHSPVVRRGRRGGVHQPRGRGGGRGRGRGGGCERRQAALQDVVEREVRGARAREVGGERGARVLREHVLQLAGGRVNLRARQRRLGPHPRHLHREARQPRHVSRPCADANDWFYYLIIFKSVENI